MLRVPPADTAFFCSEASTPSAVVVLNHTEMTSSDPKVSPIVVLGGTRYPLAEFPDVSSTVLNPGSCDQSKFPSIEADAEEMVSTAVDGLEGVPPMAGSPSVSGQSSSGSQHQPRAMPADADHASGPQLLQLGRRRQRHRVRRHLHRRVWIWRRRHRRSRRPIRDRAGRLYTCLPGLQFTALGDEGDEGEGEAGGGGE